MKAKVTMGRQRCKFYHRLQKSFLQDDDIKMYSTYNERKYVVAERFVKTLKNKVYKYMTSISKLMKQ